MRTSMRRGERSSAQAYARRWRRYAMPCRAARQRRVMPLLLITPTRRHAQRTAVRGSMSRLFTPACCYDARPLFAMLPARHICRR